METDRSASSSTGTSPNTSEDGAVEAQVVAAARRTQQEVPPPSKQVRRETRVCVRAREGVDMCVSVHSSTTVAAG